MESQEILLPLPPLLYRVQPDGYHSRHAAWIIPGCGVHQPGAGADRMTVPTMKFGPVTVYFGDKNGKYPDGNQVVVEGADSKAVFDTPLLANSLGAAHPAYDGTDLILLGHTHEDHTAGLHFLPEVPVQTPHEDLAAIQSVEGMLRHYGYGPATGELMADKIAREFHFQPRPEATGYADGTVWELGGGVSVRSIHMPGHTGGHSVLMVEPGGIAFIGDIDLSGFGPYYGDACSDLKAFQDTLARIEHMEASVWITFHHKGVIEDRETFLHLLRAFRGRIDAREEDILQVIGKEGKTLEQLVAHRFMYPRSYQEVFIDDVERMCLEGHLEILTGEGRIAEEGGVYRHAGGA